MRVKLLSQIKPWEPAIKARPHKKWKEGRPTKNTFYFERAARTLLEGAACVRPPVAKFAAWTAKPQLLPLAGSELFKRPHAKLQTAAVNCQITSS